MEIAEEGKIFCFFPSTTVFKGQKKLRKLKIKRIIAKVDQSQVRKCSFKWKFIENYQ
uniref:Uncharacterized protein n=1 Tax=Manihot esculenta TaxID=3983 RepID=A0A2C9VJW4_MANES